MYRAIWCSPYAPFISLSVVVSALLLRVSLLLWAGSSALGLVDCIVERVLEKQLFCVVALVSTCLAAS